MNTPPIQKLTTLLPLTLSEETPDPSAPWSISEALFARVKAQEMQSNMYRKVIVLPTDPEWGFVWKYFSYDLPKRYMIKSISCVHNRLQTSIFEAQMIQQDTEATTFPPNWHQESNSDVRKRTITRWEEAVKLFSPVTTIENDGRRYNWSSVKVLPLWHGTQKETCNSVCKSGFVFFGKQSLGSSQAGDPKNTDSGFFGSGIYFTNSARYAADIYSKGHLLLSWVSMRDPFPVVNGDMQKLRGSTAYKHYNAHYIPVRSNNDNDPLEPVYYPCKRDEEPHCDELVVFQTAQTLPRLWIELEPIHLYLKKISTTPNCVENLTAHCFKIMQNTEIDLDKKVRMILATFLTTLLQQEPLDDLDEEQLHFYELIAQLINNSGKINQSIRTKLIGSANPCSAANL